MNAYEFLTQAYMLEQRIQTKLHHISSLRSLAQTVRVVQQILDKRAA